MGMNISFGDAAAVTPKLREVESGYGDNKKVEVKLDIKVENYSTPSLTLDDAEQFARFVMGKVGEGRAMQVVIDAGLAEAVASVEAEAPF